MATGAAAPAFVANPCHTCDMKSHLGGRLTGIVEAVMLGASPRRDGSCGNPKTQTPLEVPMQKFTTWADARRDLWFDCVRIYLGLGLLARGLLLITNTSTGYFVDMLQRTNQPWLMTGAMLHYVMLSHFIGGALLTIGFLTRLAALIQIPILAGAVFVVHR